MKLIQLILAIILALCAIIMFYGAITKNRTTKLYRPEMLKQYPEILHKWWPDAGKIREIVKLYDLTGLHASIILDARAGRAVCRSLSP